ncbi:MULTISPECIES: MltR family transcriptional regulator [unclassified Lysobacter]|uniref:MltR family transcriptional regulator n=1 Tax=unclassified Lysobacter TaxID=2635362 RepID=UPI0009EB3049|nr:MULTISPECIES: MltR family transcriptional regulator [unclassified Lysobacter]
MTGNLNDDLATHAPVPSGDPDLDLLNRFNYLLSAHDDRGLALSLAAFAEDTLGRLLLTYLVDSKQSKDLIEGFNAPLGTLATRMKAAFAIGLLTKEQYDDLEVARKIRNLFAHDWEGVSLERSDIKSMIGQLHGYNFDQSPMTTDPRKRLQHSIANVLTELRIQIGQHRKRGRRAPFAGFRLTTIKPGSSGGA